MTDEFIVRFILQGGEVIVQQEVELTTFTAKLTNLRCMFFCTHDSQHQTLRSHQQGILLCSSCPTEILCRHWGQECGSLPSRKGGERSPAQAWPMMVVISSSSTKFPGGKESQNLRERKRQHSHPGVSIPPALCNMAQPHVLCLCLLKGACQMLVKRSNCPGLKDAVVPLHTPA